MHVRRVRLTAVIAVLGIMAAFWGAWTVEEATRRDGAVERFIGEVRSASNGAVVDLENAISLDWDRAIAIPPYSYGADVNAALGFEAYPEDRSVTPGDTVTVLLLVKDHKIVTEISPGDTFSFAVETTRSFPADRARFIVVRNSGGLHLLPTD